MPVGSGAFWNGDGNNLFTVTVGSPNGAADQYADNNSYTTHFELPEVFAANFILIYKTNNRPWENTLTITDMWGNVAFGRSNHTANTIYNDTLDLSPGCYTFEFLDTGNDGLSYWADTQQGSGYFRWKANGGGLIENFETEFGRRIYKPFVIGDIVGLNEETLPVSFSVYPNPASERITVVADGVDGVQQLRIMDMNGRVLHDAIWNTSTSGQRTIDIGDAAPGLYVVTLSSSMGTLQQRVIVD